MTISSLAPARLMLTLFLAEQRRRAARTAIIIRASQPATEPGCIIVVSQQAIFTLHIVVTINMLFSCGQVQQEVIGYRAGLSGR